MTSGTNSLDINVIPVDNFVVDGTRDVTVTVTDVADCPSIKDGASMTDTVTIADNDADLTVIKTVINTGGGTAVASQWSMDVTNTVAGQDVSFPGDEAGTDVTIAAGAYSVVESGGPGGYSQDLSAGCSGTASAGESIVCTITNTFIPPTTTTTTTTTATTATTAPTTTTTTTTTATTTG